MSFIIVQPAKKAGALLFLLCLLSAGTMAQMPLRPDAFPPKDDPVSPKAITMADSVSQMASWDRYPTYYCYLDMMQQWVDSFPTLCHLDTIGSSINNRLILCMVLTGSSSSVTVEDRPEFFYSSTIHGDEVTGFHFMLHLIDTLLRSYGVSEQLTQLMNTTVIYINPLSNPDGTYYQSNYTVQGARRANYHGVDLNRNYPNPFNNVSKAAVELENRAMIDYVNAHQFRLGANLHGGSEVFNYPWDSFRLSQRSHPDYAWWKEVGMRFVNTIRAVDNARYKDVCNSGVICGGDWYVITGGRQDYFNYYNNLYEVTLEVSTTKKLSSDNLPHYWAAQSQALINYIGEIHSMPQHVSIAEPPSVSDKVMAYPNPTRGNVTVQTPHGISTFDLSNAPAGVHLLQVNGYWVRVVKL